MGVESDLFAIFCPTSRVILLWCIHEVIIIILMERKYVSALTIIQKRHAATSMITTHVPGMIRYKDLMILKSPARCISIHL